MDISEQNNRTSPVVNSPKNNPGSPVTNKHQQNPSTSLHSLQIKVALSEHHRRDQEHLKLKQLRHLPTVSSSSQSSTSQVFPIQTSSAMVPRMTSVSAPNLGLLGQLGGMLGHHTSPLDFITAHHAVLPPKNYTSPPPISSTDPTANECKLVDYRGQKVAAFIIAGDTMLCLPQAFELFLKHLVGGLHTVYTKLKRLDIVPMVCNVEQVRILRGLGAIQPGVNRCKLLSCKDFDVLYRDCTTARPGRPPKRASISMSISGSHMSVNPSHQVHQYKKNRIEGGEFYENGHLDLSCLEKSPLLANGYNHPPTHLSHMHYMQLAGHPGTIRTPLLPSANVTHQMCAQSRSEQPGIKLSSGISNMEAIVRSGAVWENCRAAYEDIVKQLERLREETTDSDKANRMEAVQMKNNPRITDSHLPESPILNLSRTVDCRSNDEDSESVSETSHHTQNVEGDDELDEHFPPILDETTEVMDREILNSNLIKKCSQTSKHLIKKEISNEYENVQNNTAPNTEILLENIHGFLRDAVSNVKNKII